MKDKTHGLIAHESVDDSDIRVPLERFTYKDCSVIVGTGVDENNQRWATVYQIDTSNGSRKDSEHLLRVVKQRYEPEYDFKFGFAQTVDIKGLLYRLNIKERETSFGEILTMGADQWSSQRFSTK